MDAFQLETTLEQLTDDFSMENFIFDFLLAYGVKPMGIKRLQQKNNKANRLENDGELLVKNNKFFFKVVDDLKGINIESLALTQKNMRIILVTDYQKILAYDTQSKMRIKIDMDDLSKNYDFFLPLAGVEKKLFYDEKEADVKASVKMAKLFDEVKKSNLTTSEDEIRALNIFLTRLLFCFFAEDSNMFGVGENPFTNYIENVSKKDGSDLHQHIERIFYILNSKDRDIAINLREFPYVNGGLFRDSYPIPMFTTKSRKLLIECGSELNWSQINPDIFGSMIQAVVTEEHRGGLGMHYTSVPNIMKVIEPLFLDELNEVYKTIVDEYAPRIIKLEAEQRSLKGNSPAEVKRGQQIKISLGSLRSHYRKKLSSVHEKLKKIKVFDPACGSGNFLIIAYKELRALEMKILQAKKESALESEIKLSQFYGIELDDFAHEVAILSLWLTEHQMNLKFAEIFGACNPSLPLKDGGHIVHGNATRIDWGEVCPKEEDNEIYILGNPPYIGTRNQEKSHKDDMAYVFKGIKNYKNLDYIACWFYIASQYIQNINAKYAFVSTNSITQGDQVAVLWSNIFNKGLEISFAYQSFKWKNNAKNNAGVTVVIIGIENINNRDKKIYIDNLIKSVKEINGYLIPASKVFVARRSEPLLKIPKMTYGNYTGGCNELLLTSLEKNEILSINHNSNKFIRKLSGSAEFIQNKERYCLWIKDCDLEEALQNINIKSRVNQVRENRLLSKDESLQKLASRPHQFRDLKEAKISSIIIPIVSSERRRYIPIGFLDKDYIIPNSAQAIYDAETWIFGFISSYIHNLWVKAVGGSLETRIRYSSVLCYNTFPFPKITKNQRNEIEKLVKIVLDARNEEFTKTLAYLYDPDTMPDNLRQAHKDLDLYIEQCYRKKPFESDEERLAYLFKLYEKMIKEEDSK